MLTIRAEVRREEQRKDGTFRVKIRFTQNRKIKRLPTKLLEKPQLFDPRGQSFIDPL